MDAGCLTSTGRDDLLLLVHMVLVALDVAAPALQGGRRLEHVPQRLGARLAVGGEVVERRDELVALVADAAGFLPDGQRLHGELRLLLALPLIGVKNLEKGGLKEERLKKKKKKVYYRVVRFSRTYTRLLTIYVIRSEDGRQGHTETERIRK